MQLPFFIFRRGVGSVEIAIGVSLLAVILLYSINAVSLFASSGRVHVERVRAVYLAQETLEATRFLSDASWGTFAALTSGTTYYVAFSTSTNSMSATTVPQYVGGAVSSFRLSNVYRSTVDDDIVASTSAVSKVLDTSTKLVEATAVYGVASSTVSLSQYLSDISP